MKLPDLYAEFHGTDYRPKYDDFAFRSTRAALIPVELDKIADAALAYHPKNKAKKLRPKKRKKAK